MLQLWETNNCRKALTQSTNSNYVACFCSFANMNGLCTLLLYNIFKKFPSSFLVWSFDQRTSPVKGLLSFRRLNFYICHVSQAINSQVHNMIHDDLMNPRMQYFFFFKNFLLLLWLHIQVGVGKQLFFLMTSHPHIFDLLLWHGFLSFLKSGLGKWMH